LESPSKNDVIYEVEDATFEEIQTMTGDVYVKIIGDINEKPKKLTEAFPWLSYLDDLKFQNLLIYNDNLILETNDNILFVPYSYDGEKFNDTLGIRELLKLPKNKPTKILFVEQDKSFYILQINEWKY
jgi:hypothetical protein